MVGSIHATGSAFSALRQRSDQLPVLFKTWSRRHRGIGRVAFFLTAAGIVSLAGCGPSTNRLEVTGEVTLDGAPLDGGSIRFTSLHGESKYSSGAMVQKGYYEVPQKHGLPPGTYHVEISAPDANAPPVMVSATPGGPAIPVAPNRIPPDYNRDSKHTIEVTADGENHFEFAIVGKPAK
jgi:hypothetical protein